MTSRLGPVAVRNVRPGGDRVIRLHDADLAELRALVDADPIVNAVLASRLDTLRTLDPPSLGGRVYGVRDSTGRLAAACFAGGNLLPVGGGPDDWAALAAHLGAGRRTCTSIVGRADAVHAMWRTLADTWGPCRAVRDAQPLLVLDSLPADLPEPSRPDPRVRAVRPDEIDVYLPAAAAMFAEELGISPYAGTHASAYRTRIARLLATERALGIVENGAVLFKADLGALTGRTCQVQGVWVRPERRHAGIGTAATAAVLAHGLTRAPTVSLYVNDFNTPARRVYDKLGMREVATLATVLF